MPEKLNTIRVVSEIFTSEELTPALLESWHNLSREATQKNVFLCPEFVLPSIKCFDLKLQFLTVWEDSGAQSTLVGLVIVESMTANTLYPFPHLSLYRCPYSFLGGVLILPGYTDTVASSLVATLNRNELGETALAYTNFSLRHGISEFVNQLKSNADIHYIKASECSRAVVDYHCHARSNWRDKHSKNRRKSILRKRKSLDALGVVSWRCVSHKNGFESSRESFLCLEHMGWKGEQKTSLRSTISDEIFFSEVIDNLRENGVMFAELMLDDIIVASTVNLILDDTLFAFKSAYHPDFAKHSVGMLNEVYLLQHLEGLESIMYCDSCSVEGSHMDAIWPHRDTLYSGLCATSGVTKNITEVLISIRRFKKQLI